MVEWVTSAWNALPEPLRDPVALAIPAFALLLVIEWCAAIKLEDGDRGSYKGADARASLGMGVVSIATTTVWKTLALFGYTALYVYVAPWHLPADAWYTWVILIVGVDVLFYAYHRTAHRTRIIWATHQAHHSSEYFNFSTALRQKWNNSGEIVMWLPLPLLGIPPWMVFVGFSINLVYQFWVHTERIDKLPRVIEFVFNTPSHHRVHHGNDPQYLDKNYGGIFIVWDRLFGSYADEVARPHYGLTKKVDTFNIWTLQTHEYRSIARDVAASRSWRERFGFVLGPPGWTPSRAEAKETSSSSG
ncbi:MULTISPECIES: sterol desaturase family protein [Nocardiaceae]|jgi:sterol desaturase/sphingolipid hydroxylase (fatty acid hydroxylase superfamily)|uniref:sterol desaturase family protein n=1 Tax=Nocardiaceae TaxID=85025 RepID=UPI000566FFAE|nr:MULTISPECIES: sterol desaturase family protein [Rhodococcus]OZF00604.1 C-5 sterol desaturase [Rhodococcus sp. 15-1189-1-1a]OZF14486.1 C-5 sterol desaturase [Rhodococcus sp. 14-2686-1-2]OZF52452.1 C-5 sterol desaturase [Rhodococcus sp. 14-2470-1b]